MAMESEPVETQLARAAEAIRRADALLICAGAGMGVDSGLPDFRGTTGFWQAYPAFARLGLRFEELANPAWFESDPHLAWGFYGHRLNLYRQTTPHRGFGRLRRWAASKRGGGFVFTSNVDGQFQKAGFADDRVAECHGSIHHFQCAVPCSGAIRPAPPEAIRVDEHTMRGADPVPRCPRCGGVARPNVLMFDDPNWLGGRTGAQFERYDRWLRDLGAATLAVVECGAGSAVPTVRRASERAARRDGATLVRINPREPGVPRGHVGLALSAGEGLQRLDELGAV
jgi:NAD-dependent SIR2 family protein deacetylase